MKIGNMMKQAQAMQTKMQEMQEKLANVTMSGQSGGGVVNVTMNGKGEMTAITLDDSLMNAEEKDVLEDLIVAAVNDARTKVEEHVSNETQSIMGGLGLPGGMPF